MEHHHTQAMTTKTVFITGGARRIGATLARDLHASGMDIVIHHHTSVQEAVTLSTSLNSVRKNSAFLLQVDLMKPDTFIQLAAAAAGFTGRLDVLINNASVFYPTPVGATTTQHWLDITGTNMMAPYFLSQACAPFLKHAHGCIINITDIYGSIALKNHPVYSASKAGLIMLTKALARELAPAVRVNAISPGAILWPQDIDDEKKQEIMSRSLLKRMGDPGDVANAARFLINDADFITGQVIAIDGGRSVTI
jgi:pteridine reductase